MGRIDEVFRKKVRPNSLVLRVGRGPGQRDLHPDRAKALIDGGTDILELGVPFSDPVADGPTIQRADDRALAAGTTSRHDLCNRPGNPGGFSNIYCSLWYDNTIYRRGIDRFYREAHEAGVDGILVADMPVRRIQRRSYPDRRTTQDCSDFSRYADDLRSTPDSIVQRARGYLYLVSVLGVTGARKTISPEALALLHRVKKHTDIPLALGFGRSTPKQVTTCSLAGADGVIVGSAIVDIVEQHLSDRDGMETALKRYVSGMRDAAENSQSP